MTQVTAVTQTPGDSSILDSRPWSGCQILMGEPRLGVHGLTEASAGICPLSGSAFHHKHRAAEGLILARANNPVHGSASLPSVLPRSRVAR